MLYTNEPLFFLFFIWYNLKKYDHCVPILIIHTKMVLYFNSCSLLLLDLSWGHLALAKYEPTPSFSAPSQISQLVKFQIYAIVKNLVHEWSSTTWVAHHYEIVYFPGFRLPDSYALVLHITFLFYCVLSYTAVHKYHHLPTAINSLKVALFIQFSLSHVVMNKGIITLVDSTECVALVHCFL